MGAVDGLVRTCITQLRPHSHDGPRLPGNAVSTRGASRTRMERRSIRFSIGPVPTRNPLGSIKGSGGDAQSVAMNLCMGRHLPK